MPVPDIDTSAYKLAIPPSFDPLAMVGKVQGVQQGILNNRLLSQQVGGKEALGRAITAATDPATGKTDWQKGLGLLSQDQAGAFAVPELATQVQQRESNQLDIDKKQLDLSAQRWKLVGDSTGALLADKAPLTKEGVTQFLSQNLVGSGLFNNQESIGQLANAIKNLPDTDAEIRPYLKNLYLQSGMTQERIASMLGPVNMTDTGSNIIPTQVSPLTGESRTGAPIQKELSPSELAQTVELVDPITNEKKPYTRGELLNALGMGSGGSAAPVSPDGRYPGGGSAAGPRPLGVSELAPGVAEGLRTSANESATTYQKDVAEAGGYAQRVQGLDKAYAAVEKAATGPGTAGLQKFGAILNSFGIKAPTDVDSFAEAQKYTQDYANRRGAELGMGTDQARAMVNAANPGVQTPKGAALAVLNVQKGLERMQAAQVAAAQAEGVPAQKYADWRAKWNRTVDPAAFAPPKLDKAGWEAKRKELGDKWPAYKKGLDAALAAGVLSPSDIRK